MFPESNQMTEGVAPEQRGCSENVNLEALMSLEEDLALDNQQASIDLEKLAHEEDASSGSDKTTKRRGAFCKVLESSITFAETKAWKLNCRRFVHKSTPGPAQPLSTPANPSPDNPYVIELPCPPLLTATLRDYQVEGLHWLLNVFLQKGNALLADEMGLGKTIQTIAFVCAMVENFGSKTFGPCLILGPLSTLANWQSEFARFAPQVPTILYHGKERHLQQHLVSVTHDVGGGKRCKPVIITSYEVFMKDVEFFAGLKFYLVVIDEGHRIKNSKCKLANDLKALTCSARLLLTGTPLQNNIQELWSLLHFLLPELFLNLADFQVWMKSKDFLVEDGTAKAVELENKDNLLQKLHTILHPFLLRRTKQDVQLELPEKKEIVVLAPLTVEQEFLYRSVLDKSIYEMNSQQDELKELLEDEEVLRKRLRSSYTHFKPVRKTKCEVIMEQGFILEVKPNARTMDLRKVASHPYLVKQPVIPGSLIPQFGEELVTSCGKMLILDALLPRLKSGGHKVLIFSQFTSLLSILVEYMEMRQFSYVRLDGSTTISERRERIDQFNSAPDIFCFLISTRAGGLGINLTAADTVIIYDSDWNPQCDLQAQDRCHRIGQTKPVLVYRLVTDGTIDQKMVDDGQVKRRLEKMIIKDKIFTGVFKECSDSGFSDEELRNLLDSRFYARKLAVNDAVLSDDELEVLLNRTITSQPAGAQKEQDLVDASFPQEEPSEHKTTISYPHLEAPQHPVVSSLPAVAATQGKEGQDVAQVSHLKEEHSEDYTMRACSNVKTPPNCDTTSQPAAAVAQEQDLTQVSQPRRSIRKTRGVPRVKNW